MPSGLPKQGIVCLSLRWHYPSLFATTISCVKPSASAPLQSPYSAQSLLVAASPSWQMALPIVNLTIFQLVSGSIPRKSLECIYSFLPLAHRSSPTVHRVDYLQCSTLQLLCGVHFRGCKHFFTFKPQSLLAILVTPTTYSLCNKQQR